MRCPKCHFDHELQTTECLKCGIVFSRYRSAVEPEPARDFCVALAPEPLSASLPFVDPGDAIRELKCRVFALPLALLAARLLARTPLQLAAAMLAMVLHESGHAITAWFTGRWAIPLLWVTPHGQERSWFIVLLLTAGILFGALYAWKTERWRWVCAAAVALLLQVIFLSLPAEPTIVFCGDGGALVFSTLLMAGFYTPRDSSLYKAWGLRWGLLIIGALSFMHVFVLWTGPWEDIPFGEIEGVNLSDPSLLTEMYGWPETQLVDRYVRLGTICLLALLAVYIWGLVSTYLEFHRSSAPGEPHHSPATGLANRTQRL
ncbi:MAG TPA: hypothetical protein VMJ35_08730 [Dongiaceae bacterium]|nr:hypothetical protein [Dongiaceae bacterium]